MLECWKAALASGKPFDLVCPLKGSNGQFRQFRTRVMLVRDDEGRVAQWFGTHPDICEQKPVEEELRQTTEQLRIVTETMAAPVSRGNRDLKYLGKQTLR